MPNTRLISLAAALALMAPFPSASLAQAAELQASDEAVAASGSNAFGLDLYKRLAKRGGNLFFSPANISTAFAMAYSGAGGQTAEEMASVLHIGLPVARNDVAAGLLLKRLQIDRDRVQLRSANAVWINEEFRLNPEFQRTLSDHYDGALKPLDVSGDGERGRAAINGWVEEQTAGKIVDLIPEGAVSGGTTVILTSAIYMKADWALPFSPEETTKEPFNLTAGKPVAIPFMHGLMEAAYAATASAEAVELPYRGNELSMVVILPKSRAGLGAFEQRLGAKELEDLLSRVHASNPVQVKLSLPKFKLEDGFAMKAMLTEMGMKRAFTCEAEFALTTEPSAISEARHKAFIAVDEAGTEASAATAIEMVVVTATRVRPPPIVFKADHPFFFVIRDNRSGALLFMGRFTRPDTEQRTTASGPPLKC